MYIETTLIPVDEAAAYRAAGWTIGASSVAGYVSAWRRVGAEGAA